MQIFHEFFGKEYEIVFDIKITSRGCPARLYGEPGDCYPAEACEWELDGETEVFSLKLADVVKTGWRDGIYQNVTSKEWVRDQSLELADWLKDAIDEWLYENDDVACMADELAADDGDHDYGRECA